MSSVAAKAYQRLASILSRLFYDNTGARPDAVAMPEPGSDWPRHPPELFPTPWADRWGQDLFGLWCGFTVGDVSHRLRWIPPGEFQMGSPENEPKREDDEVVHGVVIPRGFWLAETACTQALWREVTGDDPSGFRGDDRPVERVSWEDAQAFCVKLNERVPGLASRLPSEAEWEYACRAGTESPFWWGHALSTELANYNGNYPYNDGPKGEYREETVAVKQFEANPWGLYQMHGNVWEWCEDWYGDYSAADAVDPAGPGRGSYRVLRGGGWDDGGRGLRAAYRNDAQPGRRDSSVGFRLATGPRPGGAEASGGAGDTVAIGSGSGRRDRGSGPSG